MTTGFNAKLYLQNKVPHGGTVVVSYPPGIRARTCPDYGQVAVANNVHTTASGQVQFTPGTSTLTILNNSGSDWRGGAEAFVSVESPADEVFGAEWNPDDGLIDRRAAIQDEIDYWHSRGGGVVLLPPGDVLVLGAIEPKDGVLVKGHGMGVTNLLQTGNYRVFSRGSGGTTWDAEWMAFEDFTVIGYWDTSQSQGNDNDRHFAVNRVRSVRFRRIESLYCKFMALTANYCDEVDAEDCRILYCARDAMNFTTSDRVRVVNNTMRHCNDDAVAIHQNTVDGNPPREGIIVQGNYIEDSFGVKCWGGRKAVISNNVMTRPKGYGIYFGVGGSEGFSDALAISITGNVITDVVQSSKFPGFGAQMQAIHITSATQNFQAPVVGGASPDYNYPENLWGLSNVSGGGTQNAGGSGINISGNVLAWTLPHTANYSDYDFDTQTPALGRAFTADGWADTDMSSGHERSGTGILLGGAILDCDIFNNTIYGVQYGLLLASNFTYMGSVRFHSNSVRRFNNFGVVAETSGVKRGRLSIRSNVFDGDPYFEHVYRQSGGVWDSGQFLPSAIDVVNFEHYEFFDNTLRNLNLVVHSNASSLGTGGRNTYYFQPDPSTTLAAQNNANKGIRFASYLGADAKISWEDSDPTSATYGQLLGAQFGLNASTIPTTGYYVAGQFVQYVGTAVANQLLEAGATDPNPQYTLIGWRRLTTGNAHVLNTDWRELRCLTGN